MCTGGGPRADRRHHLREQFDAVPYFAEAAVGSSQQDAAREVVARMEVTAAAWGSPQLLTNLRYARAVSRTTTPPSGCSSRAWRATTGDRSGQPATATLSTPSSPAAQALDIARLAARGLSNGELGQELYLSARTAGSHLYRIFPKMGISAHSQLASHLAQVEVASGRGQQGQTGGPDDAGVVAQ